MSNYKRQLMEKQRLRAQYNVGERQLRNYFAEASRRGGNVGAALLQLLETRIDALVLRAGYARTIFAARQLVVHGHVKLNGRRVSFPSHAVKPGDQVALTEKARAIPQVVMAMEATRAPSYLDLAGDGARLRELPEATQIPVTCQLPLVVEFYSR
jgi:small subunit ribosomal protein S4